MISHLDDYLIDRVFQPLADRLWRVTGRSCHWWSVQGALSLSAVELFLAWRDLGLEHRVDATIDVFASVFWCLAAREFHRELARQRPGVAPAVRASFYAARRMALVVTAGFVVVDLYKLSWDCIDLVAALMLLTLYLAACRANPPPQRVPRDLAMEPGT